MSEQFGGGGGGGERKWDFDWSTLNVTDGGERTIFCFGVVAFLLLKGLFCVWKNINGRHQNVLHYKFLEAASKL